MATELEDRQAARITELESGLRRCGEIVERHNHRQNEKVEDIKLIVQRLLHPQTEVSDP